MKRITKSIAVFCLAASAVCAQTTPAPQVRFKTNIGDIDVTLAPDVAPATVANFLNYVNKGAYANSIFHRSVPGFIIQGGGFKLVDGVPTVIPEDTAVVNEYKISNTRGTISMAKLGDNPNSATNQWFFNLADNSGNLDNQNGGFTAFGRVTSSSSLTIMDRIAGLPIQNLGAPLDTAPYSGSSFVVVNNILYIPQASAAAVQSAASFVSSTTGVSPGEFLVLYGQNLGPATLATLTLDSQGKVNTFLAGTRVLFNGTAAPMVYTSAGQVSAIVPQNLAGRSTVSIVIEYQGVQAPGMTLPVVSANPAIFTQNSSGKGDSIVIRLDGSLVTTANAAKVDDILILYGEGYGDISDGPPDGTIVSTLLPKPLDPVRLLIDGKEYPTLYAGGAGGLVSGVLQVNFKVPQLAPGPHDIQLQVLDRKSPAGVNIQTR